MDGDKAGWDLDSPDNMISRCMLQWHTPATRGLQEQQGALRQPAAQFRRKLDSGVRDGSCKCAGQGKGFVSEVSASSGGASSGSRFFLFLPCQLEPNSASSSFLCLGSSCLFDASSASSFAPSIDSMSCSSSS
ncbi:hypothetical protein WJX77_011062 [Trebouxia sp. C0004]